MIKKAVLFFFFLPFSLFSMPLANPSDSLELAQQSSALLQKKVSFSWTGGALKQGILKLSNENAIRISYSNQLIDPISVSAQNFREEPLSSLLTKLLENSSLDFITVGKTIVLVKKKEETPTPISKQESVKPGNHIYPSLVSQSLYQSLPKKIKRELWRIYGQELKQARTRNDSLLADRSSDKRHNISTPSYLIEQQRFFLSFGTGIDILRNPFENKAGNLNWTNEVSVELKNKVVGSAAFSFGLNFKHISISTGLNWQKFGLEERWMETKGRYRRDTLFHYFSSSYSTFSIPFEITGHKNFGNVYLAVKAAISKGFVSNSSSGTDALEAYHREEEDDYYGTSAFHFFRTGKKSPMSLGVGIEGGWNLQQFVIGTSISYTYWLSPYVSTPYFEYTPHAYNARLFLAYYFFQVKP